MRGIFWVNGHGWQKAAGLPGHPLAVKDVTGRIDDEDVVGPVTCQVGDQGGGVGGSGEQTRVHEGAIAAILEHRHVVAIVRDGQVGAAIAGEVTGHDGNRLGPRRVHHLVLEGAVAVTQQHRHVVAAIVRRQSDLYPKLSHTP